MVNLAQYFKCVALTFFAVALAGCVALQPAPHVARAGDTIALAVGSPDELLKTNTRITFTSDADPRNPVDISDNIAAVFNAYPDKLSRAALDTDVRIIPTSSGHEPRLSLIAVNLPSTLPVGTGSISIQTTAAYPISSSTINSVAVALEIIPGTGAPNPLKYIHNIEFSGDMTDLEPLPRYEVRTNYDPNNPGNWPLFGAVDIIWTVPVRTDLGAPVSDSNISLIFEDMTGDTASQAQAYWTRSGDTFSIRFVSPIGMQAFEPGATIVLKPGTVFGNGGYPVTTFYDLDGQPVSGPTLVILKDGVLQPGAP